MQQEEGSEVIGELTPHPQFVEPVEPKQTHMASHQRTTTTTQLKQKINPKNQTYTWYGTCQKLRLDRRIKHQCSS